MRVWSPHNASRKASIWLAALLLVSMGATSESEYADIEPISYLVYGTSVEPFQMLEGPIGIEPSTGYISDVMHAIFRDSPYRMREVIKPIKRMKREMELGLAHNWIAYGLRSWADEGIWDDATFAHIDLMQYQLSLVRLKDTPAPTSKTLRDLGVIWIEGFKYPAAEAFAKRGGFDFMRTKDHLSAVKMLSAGRAGYFMEEASRIRFALAKEGANLSDYIFYPLVSEVAPTQVTLLMSNDLGSEVHQFINERLRELQQSGELKRIAKRYGLVLPTP